jgi:hypothetical protein
VFVYLSKSAFDIENKTQKKIVPIIDFVKGKCDKRGKVSFETENIFRSVFGCRSDDVESR